MKLKHLDKKWWNATCTLPELAEELAEVLKVAVPEEKIDTKKIAADLQFDLPSALAYRLTQETFRSGK